MGKQGKESKKEISTNKTLLPFIIHRAPIENHIVYEKKGHWTQKEKLKYVIFLEYFKPKFTSRDKKKRFCRIFKHMADFIKTRTHNQCRSHHQKMEKQRFQVDDIIKNVVSKYHPRVYKQFFERYRVQIENLEESDSQSKIQKINTLTSHSSPHISDKDKKLLQNQQLQEIQIEQKSMEKEAENYLPSFPQKNQEVKDNSFNQVFITKKEPRQTRASESDSEDQVNQDKQNLLDKAFPIENSIKRQQSLDFNNPNNFYTFEMNAPIDRLPGNQGYLQSIEIKKMECLNRANFHYSQMQIEFKNIEDCQKQKQAFIQAEIQQKNTQKLNSFGYPNFLWGFSHFHQQC